MPRSVNSVAKRARRKKILKQAKGYFGRRKNVYTVAKNAIEKAMLYAYRDRKQNKRVASLEAKIPALHQTEPTFSQRLSEVMGRPGCLHLLWLLPINLQKERQVEGELNEHYL